jgi:hypothetical protein
MVSAGKGSSLGANMALLFLGIIDPHEAVTGGKVKAYWDLTEASKRRHGMETLRTPKLKGVAIFAANRVMMGGTATTRPYNRRKRTTTRGSGASATRTRKPSSDSWRFW